MPKYVIEREVPGLGKLSGEEVRAMAQRSNSVLADLAPRVQWQQSYVTDEKMYCVYIAEDEAAVVAHANGGGFPANSISQVSQVIDPTTGD